MKSRKTILIYFVFALCGCAKAPIRSDVEGFWKLERFFVLSTGETITCNRLYYSITRMVTEVSDKGSNGFGSYISRTFYENDKTVLVLKDFKIRNANGDTGEDASLEGLLHFGINSQKETKFNIVNCNGKIMTLQSEYACLELKKF